MLEASVNEFPFVEGLPKREQGKAAKTLDLIKEFSILQREHGALIPSTLVHRLLGISRQRLHELIQNGTLRAVKHHDHWFIPETAVEEFAKLERKAGRPPKVPTTKSAMWKVALATAKEIVKKNP